MQFNQIKVYNNKPRQEHDVLETKFNIFSVAAYTAAAAAGKEETPVVAVDYISCCKVVSRPLEEQDIQEPKSEKGEQEEQVEELLADLKL